MNLLPRYRPATADRLDRFYALLPPHVQARDHEAGQPLRALLRLLAEQAAILEDDIARLYENWFIETCDPWAVPYVAAPLGYRPAEAPHLGSAADLDTTRGRRRSEAIHPRRDAANTLSYNRRKGTLAVLEEVAQSASGWPARAVEFARRTLHVPHLDHLAPGVGTLPDLREADALDRAFGPFGTLAHLPDLRAASPDLHLGGGPPGGVGLYVWTARLHRSDKAPARPVAPCVKGLACQHDRTRHEYALDPLGRDLPLRGRLVPPDDPTALATEVEAPVRIRLRAFRDNKSAFYGPGKSLQIWRDDPEGQAVPVAKIVPANLAINRPLALGFDEVAVDPARGRIAIVLPYSGKPPKLWATSYRAAPADLGGGDYPRDRSAVAAKWFVRAVRDGDENEDPVTPGDGSEAKPFATLNAALRAWEREHDRSRPLAIEILDDSRYRLCRPIRVGRGEELEIRAAAGRRPIVEVGRKLAPRASIRSRRGRPGGRLTLEGLVVARRPLIVSGRFALVMIRHATLVPGLALGRCGRPRESDQPSLILRGFRGELGLDHAIVGPISVGPAEGPAGADDRRGTPPRIVAVDSVLDHAGGPCAAIGGPRHAVAFATLRVERSTAFGPVEVHALEWAQDSIFRDRLLVARTREGCVRFCSIAPGSLTPPRYRCQPDVALGDLPEALGLLPEAIAKGAVEAAIAAVAPRFRSARYGDADYARLDGPDAIRRGASDGGEMGAHHDEYYPFREANLRARVEEFTPIGTGTQILLIPD